MKTQFVKYFILSFCILSFSSCNPKKAIEEKIAKEMAGAMLGTDVDMSNIDESKESSVKVDMTMDGKTLDFSNPKSVFNIASGSNDEVIVAINIIQETNGKQRTLQLGVSGKKSLLKLPLTANFEDVTEDGKVAPIFNIMTISDNGMKISVAKKGTFKVIGFSDKKVVFEIDAEGGDNTAETHDGKNLVPIKGTIICENPIMTFIGVKKDEIF
ncbi:hypothetical protein Fleli_1640 [Bernardetia litoralis DSM 6794]|uniref:Uncharacterized protein n=1 Tax=Bernardetia litoralis (strain ATCC 23117 / DSM 6794 / NBRC 15988 / NCIMB 1366 / Fx l1 / Sio-4) TaxID=880071 RepID=I4AJB9_BERLS|nr:hypothetical protein [Bernardetia litoralis]AFM04054.1 hypothetical protein Fleli_1640 [Bernardetia litoralis DSM 6794]